MKTLKKRKRHNAKSDYIGIMLTASFIVLTLSLTGCAAGWFAGGAATGAVVQHQIEKDK